MCPRNSKKIILVNKSNNTDFNCKIVLRIMIMKIIEILLITLFVTMGEML